MKATVVMVVNVDVDTVKGLGYSSVEEYINGCTFEVHDAENNDIEVESCDYEDEYDDYDDEDDFDDDFDDDFNENENEDEDEDFE